LHFQIILKFVAAKVLFGPSLDDDFPGIIVISLGILVMGWRDMYSTSILLWPIVIVGRTFWYVVFKCNAQDDAGHCCCLRLVSYRMHSVWELTVLKEFLSLCVMLHWLLVTEIAVIIDNRIQKIF
jgi:hypothetical protein